MLLKVLPAAPDRGPIDAYIDKLKNMPKEDARKLSIQALQRTGVLDENGQTKAQIVSDEYG